jgi:type IV secretion system protein TrbL
VSCSAVNPLSWGDCAAQVASSVAGDAFSAIAKAFGQAADAAVTWLWSQVSSASAVRLGGKGFSLEVGITAGIAVVVAVGLFVIQLATATLRRDPGALARAAKGLLVASVGGGVSIGVVELLLSATDQLSAGVVKVATGGSIEGLGHALLAAGAISASVQNPAGLILVSLGALVAVVVVWAALMVRKLLLVLTAVFAPLAFAGSLADVTVSWTRRWVETTVALVASKLILVLIFVVGLGMAVDGVGQAGSGPTQAVTQVVAGLLVLMLAGFAPWMALKMVHFVGDQAHHLHLLATTSVAGAERAYSAARKAEPLLAGGLAGGSGMALAARAGGRAPEGAAAAGKPPGATVPSTNGGPPDPEPRPSGPGSAGTAPGPPDQRSLGPTELSATPEAPPGPKTAEAPERAARPAPSPSPQARREL